MAEANTIEFSLQSRLDDNETEFNGKIKAMMREFSVKMEEKERQFHSTFGEAVGKSVFAFSIIKKQFLCYYS